jgi:hypothetical protein
MNIHNLEYWEVGAHRTLTARVHAGDGTGAATRIAIDGDSEGKYIESSQVSSITMKVYDIDSDTPNTSLGSLTITSAAIITPVTSGFVTDGAGRNADDGAYNFKFSCPSTYVTADHVGHTIRKVCSITLNTGTVLSPFAWQGVVRQIDP